MSERLTGYWVYRSFRNVQEQLDASQPLDERPLFGQRESDLDPVVGHEEVKGQLAFHCSPPEPDDTRLELIGRIEHGSPYRIRLRGTGVAGTSAEGWVYDDVGYLAPEWPAGINQVPAIVDTGIRSVRHGKASAGFDKHYPHMLRLGQGVWTHGDHAFLGQAISKPFAIRSTAIELIQRPRPDGRGNDGPCCRFVD